MNYAGLHCHSHWSLLDGASSVEELMLRARELGLRRVLFGMGASLEKRRFGARSEPRAYYVRADDHYSFDVIHQISVES